METWTVHKPAVVSRHGVVVSQHALASQAGAQVLAEGGNAVDAAVTTAIALGVVEPWLSGLGGGGFLVSVDPAGRAHVLDFAMVAPHRLRPEDYPLAQGGPAKGLFGWPNVVDDRNLRGGPSICTPGAVAGLAAALERLGTVPWRRTIEPAIALAREGLEVDWFATLSIATTASELATDPESARRYLPDGVPAVAAMPPATLRLDQRDVAATLARLADAGADDFYRGDLAEALVRDLQSVGSRIDHDDLRGYAPVWREPLRARFGAATVHAVPGLSGGPTLAHALAGIEARWGAGEVQRYVAFATALADAFAARFASLGAGVPGGGTAAGADAAAPVLEAPDSCTTHVSVVDRHGHAVALTNTLLSRFGSMVTSASTGLLMNNGVMWFDPVPGKPNSIRPGVRPLANMSPTVTVHDDGRRWAVGAAGGRRIVPTVAQLLAFLVLGDDDAATASRRPRLDLSTASVGVDPRLSADVRAALAARGPTHEAADATFPGPFATASVAGWDDGTATGVAHLATPWAAAVAAAR